MTTFADAQIVTLAALRAQAGTEATYGTRDLTAFPAGDVPALPYAMVRTGPTSIRYPVTATASVRVVVWADTEAASVALAWRLLAALMDYPGDATVRGFGDPLGPVPAEDPDVPGRPLASFTVAARLRPIST